MRIVEFGNARFIKHGEISGSMEPRKEKIQEDRLQIPLPVTSSKVVFPMVIERINNFQVQQIDDPMPHNELVNNKLVVVEPQEITL